MRSPSRSGGEIEEKKTYKITNYGDWYSLIPLESKVVAVNDLQIWSLYVIHGSIECFVK